MVKEESGNSAMQVEINKNDILWLKGAFRDIKKETEAIQSTLLKILIAMTVGAFGFIGTLLTVLLTLG